MRPSSIRRHNRWYECLLLSRGFWLLLGWWGTVVLPYVLFWSWQELWQPDEGQTTALCVTSLAYGITQLVLLKIRALYPGGACGGVYCADGSCRLWRICTPDTDVVPFGIALPAVEQQRLRGGIVVMPAPADRQTPAVQVGE